MRSKLFGFFIALGFFLHGQDIEVKGGFLKDSLRIGENTEYWMSVKYPSQVEMLLPDSNFNFSPFEFGSRKYFETKLENTQVTDSVVYSLQSFEIDLKQYFNLPAISLVGQDCTKIFTPKDSIYLIELVTHASDTTKVIENTEYFQVARQFNNPLLMIILGVMVFISLIVLIVFGKKIKRHFILKRMKKAHTQFLSSLSNCIEELKKSGEPSLAEKALTIWKIYQERIEKQPFSKLTSKEIVAYDFAEELKDPLRAIDRCVYGKAISDNVYQDFQHLEGFSENRYKNQVETIKHGE